MINTYSLHTYSLGTFVCTTCDNQDHHAKLFSLFQIADLSCETRSMYKLLSSLAYLTVSGKMLKYLCPLGQMAAACIFQVMARLIETITKRRENHE